MSSEPLDLRIVSPGATPAEIAAVTAVLRTAIDEMTAELDAATPPAVSAWQRSQRSLRAPLHPAPGAWRGFAG